MKKLLALLLCMALILAVMAGCAGESTPQSSEAPEDPVQETSQATAAPAEEPAEPAPEAEAEPISALPDSYPMIADHDVSVNVWYAWPPPLDSSGYTDPSEFPFYQNLSQRTGVDFEFTIIGMAVASEQFNLMVASETLPDIITEPSRYDGSSDAALDEGVYYDITDLIEMNAPDYYELVNREENFRDCYSDTGRMGGFWEIAEEEFPPNSGLFIRQDMLEAVGMTAPETYEEFHDVLAAVKDKYGCESPYWLGENLFSQNISGGLGLGGGFVNRDGTAVYSVLADNFKDYISMLKDWYDEGLIYGDFYSLLDNSVESDAARLRLVNTDNVAVWYNWCEDIIQYAPENSDYAYAAITDPVMTKGEVNHLAAGIDPRINNTSGWALSGTIDHDKAVLICQLANYLYTDEGALLANWGVEGESFVYDDNGEPMWTDLVMNNPNLMTNVAIGVYAVFRGANRVDLAKFNQNARTVYKEYCDVWSVQDNAWTMPNLSMTSQEQERYSSINADIDTMMDENLVRFVLGDRPLSELDAFIEELKALGLDEMVSIEQAAFDRYLAK